MATLQNQYQVLKLKSDFIVARNLNVENYSKSQAAKDGALVSIGDKFASFTMTNVPTAKFLTMSNSSAVR